MTQRRLISALILGLGLAGGPVYSQGEAELPPPPEAAAEAEAPAGGSQGGGAGSMDTTMDIGFDFDKLQAENIQYTSDGALKMIGRVVVRSPQLNLDSSELSIDPATKVMTATGSPVEIEQGDVTATCKNFRYNTEKKESRLTGDPQIMQKTKDGHTLIKGDIITIVQGKDGKPSVNVSMNKDSGRMPIIEQIKNTKPTTAGKPSATKAPAKKVTNAQERAELIKLPELN